MEPELELDSSLDYSDASSYIAQGLQSNNGGDKLMLMNSIKRVSYTRISSGFTIVELLIVIVVIAILAAIVVVAYNGVQQRANESSAEATVKQVGQEIKIYKTVNGAYPDELSDIEVQGDDDLTYSYGASTQGFCLSATVGGVSRSVTHSGSVTTGSCEFALVNWSFGNGVSLGANNAQLELNTSESGSVYSPFIHNDGADSVRISFEAYATQPSPNRTPNSSAYLGSNYYAADKVTLVDNTSGYTGNGNASCVLEPNQWRDCSWSTPTGPDVEWMRFRIHSAPGSYTSDNVYRNFEFTVND